jgi:hypothetical protein
MTKYQWLRLRVVEDLADAELKKDEFFLNGHAMIGQKDTKEIGQQITYFKVIKAKGKNIEYTEVFDVLEEDEIDARRN